MSTTTDRRSREIFPQCRAYFDAHIARYGVLPQRNEMMRTMHLLYRESHGITEPKARTDWERLKAEWETPRTDTNEEGTVNERTTIESPIAPLVPAGGTGADATELAMLRRQVQALANEVQHLRAMVQVVSPPRDPEGELPSRVARLAARQAGQERAIATLEDQLRVVALKVNAHDTVVMTVQELLALLSVNDDAYDTLERMIRPASSHSQRTLQRFLWGKIGRKLHTNDFVPTP